MEILAIDLGTTNIKVAAFDAQLQLKWLESTAVTYETSGVQVEFDCEGYFEVVLETLMRGLTNAKRPSTDVRQIVLTGQAESLVVLDRAM